MTGLLWHGWTAIHAPIAGSVSPTGRLLVYYWVPQFKISSMCRICTSVLARLLAPAHIGVSFKFDEEGVDRSLFQQDQSYFASDCVQLRERPVIVHFLDGHREALNRRHCRSGSTADVFTRNDQMISQLSSAPGIVTAQTGNARGRLPRGLYTAITWTKE